MSEKEDLPVFPLIKEAEMMINNTVLERYMRCEKCNRLLSESFIIRRGDEKICTTCISRDNSIDLLHKLREKRKVLRNK